jgi:hypothetical protein
MSMMVDAWLIFMAVHGELDQRFYGVFLLVEDWSFY